MPWPKGRPRPASDREKMSAGHKRRQANGLPDGRPPIDFWLRVTKGDGCWMFANAKGGRLGYGSVGLKGKTLRAHRVAWQLTYGPIPDGLCVLHKCDTPGCVRPDHLWLGTQVDNVADREKKGRGQTREVISQRMRALWKTAAYRAARKSAFGDE